MPGQALALQGFPGIVYIKRGGIHCVPGIVNDVVRDFVSVLCDFQLVENRNAIFLVQVFRNCLEERVATPVGNAIL